MKKGFTLIELLGVIILLGLIGLIIVPSITKLLKDSRQNLYQNQIKMIEESARKWGLQNNDKLSEESKTYLSVTALINDGYIEQDEIKDPRKKEDMNGCIVISYNPSSNKFTYAYNDNSCTLIRENPNLTSSDPEYVCYEFEASSGTILHYDKSNPNCSMNVNMPAKIDNIDVRYIGEYAFCDIDECRDAGGGEIGNNQNNTNTLLSSLGTKEKQNIAFVNLNVGSVTNNAIESLAFVSNKKLLTTPSTPNRSSGRYIESVLFSKSIVGINEGAFAFNNITSLDLNDLSNLRYIDDGAFAFNNIANLNITGLTNLEEIGFYSFASNSLTSLTLEELNRLNVIYGNAFAYNQINTLILDNLPNLEKIGHEAFEENDISSLDLTGVPNLYRIGWDAFAFNSIESLNLTGLNYLEEIGSSAFQSNQLSSVIIPTGVEYIESYAFAYNNISSVNLEELTNLRGIGSSAFEDNQLSSVTIPIGVEYIESSAFMDNNISSVNLEELTNLVGIGSSAFQNNQLSSVIIPIGVEYIESSAFMDNPITSVTIEGDNQYRFNNQWVSIGFPEELMLVIEMVVNLSTSSVNNFEFVNYAYYQATVVTAGIYKLEVWGAAGGQYNSAGGKGGYSKGLITLTVGDILNVYVGEKGSKDNRSGGFNGGGSRQSYGGSGGGATDIRIGTSYNDRIIVAGGGGGSGFSSVIGGYGGGTVGGAGGNGSTVGGGGGTQSSGGSSLATIGLFGYAQANVSNGGGGGGWYGGGSGNGGGNDSGGGGGSGYVLTSSSHKPSGYSPNPRFYMTEELLIAGNQSMPTISGGTMTGNTGNGYAKITYIGS